MAARTKLLVSLSLSVICVGAVWVALTAWSVTRIRDSAESTANGAPYCLQVSADNHYREVRTLLDLSIFDMRSASGLHHAVLAVDVPGGTQLMHWSYRREQFVSGALGPPAIYCTPRPHDLETIGLRRRPESPLVHIRSRTMSFSIPKSYSPVATGNSNGLNFYANAPLFERQEIHSAGSAVLPQDRLDRLVEVVFGVAGSPTGWLGKNDRGHKVEEAESEYGLGKQLVWNLPPGRSPSYRPSVDYFLRLPDGKINTIISCDSVEAGDCLHMFHADGWTYTFHHPKKYLADWKTMQARLSNLTRSFLTTEPATLHSLGIFESHIENSLGRPTPPAH